MIDNRNMILAIVISVVILLGFNFWHAKKYEDQAQLQGTQQTEQTSAADSTQTPQDKVPGAGGVAAPTAGKADEAPALTRTEAIAETPRVRIDSDRLHGSISLIGGRVDDLTLKDYHEELDPESPEIVLLEPHGMADSYFAQFGWTPSGKVAVPDGDTEWKADKLTLATDDPVTLTWDNGQGLTFVRTITLDGNYMFTISQKVENTGDKPVTLSPYGLISRGQTPDVTRFYILHEGPLGVFGGTLKEVDYSDLKDDKKTIHEDSTGGWIGITDKYWLTALVPDQNAPIKASFTYHLTNSDDRYQVDYLGDAKTLQPGETAEVQNRLFAGAKEVKLLDSYADNLGITNFDKAIDFGWFYFLTKPIFYGLQYIHGVVGNFGIAILLLTVVIKLAFFPLANKSYKAMSKMKKLQPEMQKLRELHGDDRQRMNQEMMALYKREKANPASGCLPMLIQIPVFFALYKVLFVTIEMRHAPFFGWIHDLSAPDPTSIFNLFGLIPWDPSTIVPAAVNIGIWPLIMGVTMFLQQKLNPQPADPVQAKVFMFLPLIFTFLLAHFPAGLVIYWAWNNSLSILQQWVIMKRAGVR